MGKNLNEVSPEDKKQVQTSVEKRLQEEIDKKNKAVLDAYEESATYNETIDKHDKRYSEFVPMDKVLVRVYRRLPQISTIDTINGETTSIIIDTHTSADYAKVMRQAATGQNFTARQVPTEFKLSTKAIVVATPSFEQRIKVGDTVCIEQLLTQAVAYDGGEEIIYQHWFVHPDSNKAVPPHNPTDPDYGYALIPTHLIKGIL